MAGGPGHAFGLAAHCGLTLRGGQRDRTHLRGAQIFYDSTASLRVQYRDIARCVVKACVQRLGVRASTAEINRIAAFAIGAPKTLSRGPSRRLRLADAG